MLLRLLEIMWNSRIGRNWLDHGGLEVLGVFRGVRGGVVFTRGESVRYEHKGIKLHRQST